MITTLKANLSGTARTATYSGREWIIAPMTLIVPGVLCGSSGCLLYPESEVSKNSGKWNGSPLTVGHPRDRRGFPVSARSPGVVAVGRVHDAAFKNGRLSATGWFDVDRLRRVSPDLLADLKGGRPVPLSTGLFTDDTPVRNGVHTDGRRYAAVARNYRPDHVAVFADGTVGACSVDDGCGVGVLNSRRGRPMRGHDYGCRCTACTRGSDRVPVSPLLPTVNWAEAKKELDGVKPPTANGCGCQTRIRDDESGGPEVRKWLAAGSYEGPDDDDTPTANDYDDYTPSPMILPRINWAEEKKLLDARGR